MSKGFAVALVVITFIQGMLSQSTEANLMLLLPSGRGMSRKFNLRDNLTQFALRVQQQTGLRREATHYVFQGKLLEDGKSLQGQGVRSGSLIALLSREPGKIYVVFRAENELAANLRFHVKLSDKLVGIRKSLPQRFQHRILAHKGKVLQDDKTIQELGIQDFDEITIRKTS